MARRQALHTLCLLRAVPCRWPKRQSKAVHVCSRVLPGNSGGGEALSALIGGSLIGLWRRYLMLLFDEAHLRPVTLGALTAAGKSL